MQPRAGVVTHGKASTDALPSVPRRRGHRARSPVPVGDRYRIVIYAQTVDDLVGNAGGLTFDSSAAGWEVVACLRSVSDVTPLRVLGATVVIEMGDEGSCARVKPADVVIASASLGANHQLAEGIVAASRRSPEFALWGHGWPLDAGPPGRRLAYEPSGAATMFKRIALGADHAAPAMDHIDLETFQQVGGSRNGSYFETIGAPYGRRRRGDHQRAEAAKIAAPIALRPRVV